LIDDVIALMRSGFELVKDKRRNNLAFAMFSLKDSSLSAFKEQFDVRSANLERVYGVSSLPGDTALREGIDEVLPKDLQALFKPAIDYLKKEGVLEQRRVLGKYIAVPVDGTGYYCSGKKSCPQCLVKNHRSGEKTYYHQLLGAVAVHPEQATVFPIACEAIVKQDGDSKNDCELNAAKRIIPQIRATLGDEAILGIFDALFANGPHIKALKAEHINYIIATKGKTYTDIQAKALAEKNQLETLSWQTKQGRLCRVRFSNQLILNGQHQDIKTNYVEYHEVNINTNETTFYSTWITDILITKQNVKELVKVARSRWKIENETFNTLKNQGYHLEHNYGHGKKYLATNFAILTFLAFLTDQIAQHLDKAFQQAKRVCKTFKSLWEKIRFIFYLIPARSMNAIYKFITKRQQIKMPIIQ